MGVISEISCSRCSYVSDKLHLGSGVRGGNPKEVLVCTHCSLMFAGAASIRREPSPFPWEVNSHCQCPSCDAECAPPRVSSLSTVDEVEVRSDATHVQCPKCGSLDTKSRIIGLWD